jgi:hypothetical protein
MLRTDLEMNGHEHEARRQQVNEARLWTLLADRLHDELSGISKIEKRKITPGLAMRASTQRVSPSGTGTTTVPQVDRSRRSLQQGAPGTR